MLSNIVDLHRLKLRCQASIKRTMIDLGGEVVGKFGQQYAFKDNGSNILAVAHLDTLRQDNHFEVVRLSGDTLVFNSKLDDRLGVYTILDLLPRLGIVCDILLTENEELGASTAANFVANKQYNWIVEFDRSGTDVVTYEYDWDLVREYFDTGVGTFSDISKLQSLKCKALNVGIGYYNEHDKRSYFVVEEYIEQIAAFFRFWTDHADLHYPHEPVKCSYGYQGWQEIYGPFDEEEKGPYWCPVCHATLSKDEAMTGHNGELVCAYCGNEVVAVDENGYEKDY